MESRNFPTMTLQYFEFCFWLHSFKLVFILYSSPMMFAKHFIIAIFSGYLSFKLTFILFGFCVLRYLSFTFIIQLCDTFASVTFACNFKLYYYKSIPKTHVYSSCNCLLKRFCVKICDKEINISEITEDYSFWEECKLRGRGWQRDTLALGTKKPKVGPGPQHLLSTISFPFISLNSFFFFLLFIFLSI